MTKVEAKKLLDLAIRWRRDARDQVPDAYMSRGMEDKYLCGDNEAAGWEYCALVLLELLEKEGHPVPYRRPECSSDQSKSESNKESEIESLSRQLQSLRRMAIRADMPLLSSDEIMEELKRRRIGQKVQDGSDIF